MNDLPFQVWWQLSDSAPLEAVRHALALQNCEVIPLAATNSAPTCEVVIYAASASAVDLPSDVGRVCLGDDPAADVCLPRDASSAELARCVRLVGQLTRLRRQLKTLDVDRASLRDQALRDALTGVLNRRAWDEQLANLTSATNGQPRPWAVAIADVDRFKVLNDTAGHPAGDTALCQVAEALRSAVRPGDCVARIGGDEFGIILVGIEPVHVSNVLARLQQQATQSATISIGGVSIPAGERRTSAEILAAADSALIEAKRTGRDRVLVKQSW